MRSFAYPVVCPLVSELTELLRERARAALPPVDGELRVAGLRAPVQILRDRWGVPHIYAESVADVAFAQGFAVASERLFQLEVLFRLGSGRLSELFGEPTLPLDRFVRTVGWNRAARSHLAAWDERDHEIGDAFAAGIRSWADHMPARPVEYDILQADPLVPEPEEIAELASAAAVFMAWSLSANWDCELLRAEVASRLGWEAVTTLFPAVPAVPATVIPGKSAGRSAFELLKAAPPFPRGQGSNNWVVSGQRSVTGTPLLANDPHLLAQAPSIWFEVHLSAPGLDVAGVAIPFSPGVLLGHNARIAWGCTNVGGDTQDLYREQLNEDRTAALYEGRWDSLTVHRERIAIRGRPEPEILEVRETRHGPILDAYLVGLSDIEVVEGGIAEPYALRWVGLEYGPGPGAIHRLNAARDVAEFRAALAEWSAPGQNFVYADVEGTIGYQCTGLYPIRRGGDGTLPVPGWTAAYEWEGFVPFEELPSAINPDDGFLCSANARPHGEGYPHFMGRDFLPPFRLRRIAQLLTASPLHDRASFARMQVDTVSLPAMDIVPLLLTVEPADERQRAARALLTAWDFDLAAGSAAAAVYEVWCLRISEAILRPRLGSELYEHVFSRRQWTNEFHVLVLPRLLEYPTATWFGADGIDGRDALLRAALDAALDELTERLGPDMDAWAWGGLHHVRLVGQLGRRVPDLEELFTVGVAPHGGDEQTLNQGLFEPGAGTFESAVVASWRQIIDLGDFDASVGTHTGGQSGNPASPHYADQFALWSAGRYHPLPFTRDAVEAATESRLRLKPA